MQYLLLIYGDEKAYEAATSSMSEADQAAEMSRWYDYTDWLRDKGWYLGGEALQPTGTATTVRPGPGGEPAVTDGPFAETKEQLGGYYLLEVGDVDQAIEAGRACPGARFGSVELRPIMSLPDRPE